MRCMRPGYLAYLSLFLVIVFWPAGVSAQSTAIAGAVRDTTGAALPGVTVEASSPALIEKVRTAVTNDQGRYNIINLQPGVYTVTFSLSGFRTVLREGIAVVANTSVPINADLEVGAIEETITVSGETPVVDVQQAAQRQVLNRQQLETLPTSRMYISAGVVMPGIKTSNTPDVGGTASTIFQTYLVSRGKKGGENTMEVDGLDVRSPRGDDQQSVTNIAMAEEVVYQISALSADAAGGGVRIRMIPRDGGNTFNGEVFVGGMHNSLQSDNITDELRARGLPTATSTRNMFEVTPAVGGPIVRDKLWYYGSVRLNEITLAPAGAQFADGRPGYNDTFTRNISGRLIWQATPRNKVTGYEDISFRYQSATSAGFGDDWATVPTQFKPNSKNGVRAYKWTSPATNSLLFEAGYSGAPFHGYWNEWQPGVLKERGSPEWYANASHVDLVLGRRWVAPGPQCCTDRIQTSHIAQGAVSYVTGSHAFKAGMQWRRGILNWKSKEGNGALEQRYRNGVPDSVLVRAAPTHLRPGIDRDIGLFAQDSWTIDRLTVNAGVRWDYWRAVIEATDIPAGRFVAARSVEKFNPMPVLTDLNPRFSIAYDVFGNARTAIKGNASRYVVQGGTFGAAESGVSRFSPVAEQNEVRNWFDCDFVPGTSTCSGRSLPTNGDDIAQDNEIGASNNRNFGISPDLRADPDMKREYYWDYALGLQHELAPGVAVSGGWYHTRFGNLVRQINTLLSLSDYTPFQVVNPLDNQEMITVYNLNQNRQGLVDTLVTSSDINSRTYNGFEATIQARLPMGATVGGGWFAERLLSNTCDTNNPNEWRFCDHSGELHQELGQLSPLPYRHEFKLALTSPLPGGFTGGLSMLSFPGTGGPTSGNLGDLPPYLIANWVVPPNLFPGGRTQPVTVNLLPPGTQFLPRWTLLDVSLRRDIRVGGMQLRPGISVFNLLNSSTVLSENRTFGPALGQPTSTLQGRFVKLEVLVKF